MNVHIYFEFGEFMIILPIIWVLVDIHVVGDNSLFPISELGTATCPRIKRKEEIVAKYSGFYPLHKDYLLEKTYWRISREIQDRFYIILNFA